MKLVFALLFFVAPSFAVGRIKITPMAGSVEAHYYTPTEVMRWQLASLPIELPGPGTVVLWNQWWDNTNYVMVETTSTFQIPDEGLLHLMVGQGNPGTNSSVQPGPHRAYVVEESYGADLWLTFWAGFGLVFVIAVAGHAVRVLGWLSGASE